MSDLRVTLIQVDPAWEAIAANLAMFAAKIDSLDQPTDLIVLPEMFSTGFSMQAARLAETMDGRAVNWLRRMARQKNADITGSLIIEENGHYYNRLIWAHADGRVSTYDKRHLFRYAGEDKVFSAGQRALTVTLKGWRIRPFICYDLRFPVWTRNLGLVYDMALFVANWPATRAHHWQVLLRARAIENQAYVIGANRIGTDGNRLYYDGRSSVIAPDGDPLYENEQAAAMPTLTLLRSKLEEYRRAFPAWMDADQELK